MTVSAKEDDPLASMVRIFSAEDFRRVPEASAVAMDSRRVDIAEGLNSQAR
jgi:hypothetical protein